MSDEGEKHDHPGRDFIVPGPMLEDGRQTVIRHREDHTLELAELRPVEDGKPIPEGGELVHISGEGPSYDVKSLYKAGGTGQKGPAKVTSESYRSGWDAVFGAKAADKSVN